MRKGKSLLGLKVISEMDGADLGRVKDLIFDHNANQVLALLMSEKDLFGLIDAQIVPWDQISYVGPDAITVTSSGSRIKAGDDPRVAGVMGRETALSGTHIYTTNGKHLGTLADTYLDDKTGFIEGYEISGGFVSDTMTGKRFLPSHHDLVVGRDVALIEPMAAEELEPPRDQSGGLAPTMQMAGTKVNEAYLSVAQSLSEAYADIASASTEKQKAFVVGKIAARDVILPAPKPPTFEVYNPKIQTPGAPPADVTSSGEVVAGEVLVRQGEIITAEHAERAAAAGVLSQLVTAALESAATTAYESSRETVSTTVAAGSTQASEAGASLQTQVEDAAAGIGEAAASLWEAARQKVTELTHSAQEKKAEYDQAAMQSRINHALGRPVTRVILDPSDEVILHHGDIITHAAVARAREAGVLDVLLDSVFEAPTHPDSDTPLVNGASETLSAERVQPDNEPVATAIIVEAVEPDSEPQPAKPRPTNIGSI